MALKGKQVIEEIDFLKSQAQDKGRVWDALKSESIRPDSLRVLLRRRGRTDLIEFLYSRADDELPTYECGQAGAYDAGCRCVLCKEANNDRARKWRQARTVNEKDPNDPRHGTASFYQNHGCRCDGCKAAHKVKVAEQYQRRLALPIDPSDRRHGTPSFYRAYGCRCSPCKEAGRAYDARRQATR